MSLNWKELRRQVDELQPRLLGASLQKISVLAAPAAGEIYLFQCFSAAAGPGNLLISAHQQSSFFGFLPRDLALAKNQPATTFVMVLRKYLLGVRITALVQAESERILRLEFEGGKALLLELVPRRGNLVLLDAWDEGLRGGRLLGSHRPVSLAAGGIYQIPESKPYEPKSERDFQEQSGSYSDRVVRHFLNSLAGNTWDRWQQLLLQGARGAAKKLEQALANLRKDESKWEKEELIRAQAAALNAYLYQLGPKNYPREKSLKVPDPIDPDSEILLPLDPSRTYAENSEQLFRQAKKFHRAKSEHQVRLSTLQARIDALAAIISAIEGAETGETLEPLSQRLRGFGVVVEAPSAKEKKSKPTEAKEFLEVVSTDGFRILCGRNQSENRQVTFVESSSSDIWLHLKGLPGAHVVVKAQKNKSVPLSTLLEACQLCLFYSKIRNGKKADVDYTFRKHVRAIKGTLADVTYTDNKTLYLEADAQIVRKLLREDSGLDRSLS